MANTLGEELSASLTNITALIVRTESKSQRARLTRQQAQIAGQLQVFIDKTVDEALRGREGEGRSGPGRGHHQEVRGSHRQAGGPRGEGRRRL